MKNKLMEYPHPVLYTDGRDFIESNFSYILTGQSDEENNIIVSLMFKLSCDGLIKMIDNHDLEVIIKVYCPRTSYRTIERIIDYSSVELRIPKELVTDTVIIQGLIVSKKNNVTYKLDEFNQKYFNNQTFSLKKGDVVAYAEELIIRLNSILEKNIPSIVLVSTTPDIKDLKLVISKTDEQNEKYKNYITIWLPQYEYLAYESLRRKKVSKTSVARFLQSSVIIPAVVEAISKLRMEDSEEPDDPESTYHGTIWADSICEVLKDFGISDLNDCPYSDYELANRLLGDVVGDSLNNLQKKMQDWSMLSQEDEIL